MYQLFDTSDIFEILIKLLLKRQITASRLDDQTVMTVVRF